MKKYFAFLLIGWCVFLCAVPRAQAQGEGAIHGAVVAKADGSALPNTMVRLEGISVPVSLETQTADDGHFGFQRLIPGDYSLVVRRQDFAEERIRFTLKPREVRNITLELALATVAQSVEVTTEGEIIAPTYSPSSTTLQHETFEALPMAQRTNLPDVIVTSTPGMIRGHDDFVHIRGHEIALNPFINGVSFWENAHSVFSSGLGLDYIESMNVMTGGFSAEYGNRFGGVLDVVTKSGFTMNNNGSITLGLGTALRHNAGIEFGGHTEHAAYYLNLGGFESARFLSPPEPNALHDTGRGARSFVQLDFNASSNDFLKLIFMGDGTNFELPKTLRDAELRPNFNNFERTRSQSMILSWDHLRSADTLLHTAFYQRRSRIRMLPNADPYGAKLDAERMLGTFGIKSDLTRFLGKHTLKGGVDLVLLRPDEQFSFLAQPWIDFTHLPNVNEPHIHFRGPNRGPVVFQQEKTGGQISLYLQDKVQLTRGFTADIGLRYDRYSLAVSKFHFSPRLNLAYEFPSRTVLHGSYNHFFVPPPVENLLATSAGLTRFISEVGVPLPPLRPFVENQFELGVTQPIAHLLNVGLTGYYRIGNDTAHTTLFPDSRFYAYANFDKGKAYGMEIKAEMPTIPAVGLSGYFNYALGRVWFYNPVTAGFITEAEHLTEKGKFLAPMDQTHTLTSGFTYRHHDSGLWASMAFEYGSGTPGSHGAGEDVHEEGEAAHTHAPIVGGCGVRCPEHFTQNLTFGWDAIPDGEQPRLSLQFNIENLTNNVYLISKESTFVQGQYSAPRLYSGSLKIRF
ncbi:MAG: TonB-dependent receptor [Acidobacteria bacterium]|nr:TonB-dependent receptor [Acidobacteriota bacterium]